MTTATGRANGVLVSARRADEERYWRECDRYRLPFIQVKPARRYALVRVDLIATRYELTDAAVEHACTLTEPYWTRQSYGGHGKGGIYVFKVERARAEELAQRLSELVNDPENVVEVRA